jgi:hypothetical protein
MPKKSKTGYGNPPKHTRFKKGKSGNPNGRPKGSKNLKTVLVQEMNRTIEIREGDRVRRVSKLEALPMRLFERALNGDMRAATALINLILKLLPIAEAERVVADLSVEDQEIIAAFLQQTQSD